MAGTESQADTAAAGLSDFTNGERRPALASRRVSCNCCRTLRSASGRVDEREPLLAGGVGEAVVEGDELQGRRATFGGYEGGAELERVRRTERMDAEKADGAFAHDYSRNPFEARRRRAERSSTPPRTSPTVPALGDQGVDSQFARVRAGRSRREKRRRQRPRAGLASPSRTSRSILPASAPSSLSSAGSSRATGRPRSAIKTGEPFLRPSISALRLFFASVMLAFFIGPQ